MLAPGWVDICIAAFLLLSIVIGLARGFVFEVLSLIGWFAAWFAAVWFEPLLLPLIHAGPPGAALNHWIAFGGIFIVALIVWGLGAKLIRSMIRATPLSGIDRLLGAGFGIVRGLAVLLLLATVISISPLGQSAAWRQSQSSIWLGDLLQMLRPLFLNDDSQLRTARTALFDTGRSICAASWA